MQATRAARWTIWPVVAITAAAEVAFAGQTGPLSQLAAAAGIALIAGMACWMHGWKGCALMLTACLAVTFSIENLSVATGFPFGRYHFEVDPGWPRVGTIPLIVGPLYFGMGYAAWTIAGVLLDDADLHLDRAFNVLALPIVAAFVATAWDLVMDPPASTLEHAWIWHDGGGYFGVPLSNYFGWLLTTWLFFQVFALMFRRWPSLFVRPQFPFRRDIQAAAALLYLAVGLAFVAPWLNAPDAVVIDRAGATWRTRDVREAAVIIMMLSMAPTAVLALLRLAGWASVRRRLP
jgi:putative membrane protein